MLTFVGIHLVLSLRLVKFCLAVLKSKRMSSPVARYSISKQPPVFVNRMFGNLSVGNTGCGIVKLAESVKASVLSSMNTKVI